MGGYYSTLTFRVVGPAANPAIIRLDNFSVQGQTNWSPQVFDATYCTDFAVELTAPVAELLASAYDPDNDPLTASLGVGPAHGQLSFDPLGNFVYTPNAGFSGADQFTYVVSDGNGGRGTATVRVFVRSSEPPQVLGTEVNNATVQRSLVKSVTLTFSEPVSFLTTPSAAFTLTRNTDGAPVGFTATVNLSGGVTVVTLNGFSGTATHFGSLTDGRYTLRALASQISSGGQQLDGNGDGAGGDDYTFGDAQGLFRFFGDYNGDRNVDIADFGLFSSTYGLNSGQAGFISAFDFNGDGVIDIADFGQFAIRIFTVLP
jgi:hypothetical protein